MMFMMPLQSQDMTLTGTSGYLNLKGIDKKDFIETRDW